MPPCTSPIRNGNFAGRDDRKTTGLIARVHIGELNDSVARHVVVIERLAELLRRKHAVDLIVLPPGCLLDFECAPHSSIAFCSGWLGGTQCDSLS